MRRTATTWSYTRYPTFRPCHPFIKCTFHITLIWCDFQVPKFTFTNYSAPPYLLAGGEGSRSRSLHPPLLSAFLASSIGPSGLALCWYPCTFYSMMAPSMSGCLNDIRGHLVLYIQTRPMVLRVADSAGVQRLLQFLAYLRPSSVWENPVRCLSSSLMPFMKRNNSMTIQVRSSVQRVII